MIKTLKKFKPKFFKKSRHTVNSGIVSYKLVFDYINLHINNQIEPIRFNTVINTLEIPLRSSGHLQIIKKVF
ncbi:MAG: hypothetical protein CMB31_06590 [Euryarchaeota archaeon]|nr:hypothetical protein [Euryarchaeota archaeon]